MRVFRHRTQKWNTKSKNNTPAFPQRNLDVFPYGDPKMIKKFQIRIGGALGTSHPTLLQACEVAALVSLNKTRSVVRVFDEPWPAGKPMQSFLFGKPTADKTPAAVIKALAKEEAPPVIPPPQKSAPRPIWAQRKPVPHSI